MKDHLGMTAQREDIVDAFIARYGLLPEQCEQVVRINDQGETVYFIRKRRNPGGADGFDSTTDVAEKVIKAVCSAYSDLLRPVTPEQVVGRHKTSEPVTARHLCMFILREHYSLTLSEAGASFNRHHATVIYGVRMARTVMVERQIVARVYRNVCTSLKLEPLI